MSSNSLAAYFLLGLIGVASLLAFFIFQPFLLALAMAAAFAVVLQPLHLRLRHKFPGFPSAVAGLTLFVAVIGILVPVSFIGVLVGREVVKLYTELADGTAVHSISVMFQQAETFLTPYVPFETGLSDSLATNITSYAQDGISWLTAHIGPAFSSIASVLLQSFVFFVALFFFLRDGEALKRSIVELSPLADADDEKVFDRLGLAVNSVIRGNLLIALIRGVLAAIGFIIFGVPSALLWGTVTGILGLIPGVGIVLVFAPAVVYAFMVNGAISAMGLLAWGVIVVGLVDNILGPKIVGKGMRLHPFFILLAVLGGIAFFGPLGIFLGPLSLSFLVALFSIYSSTAR